LSAIIKQLFEGCFTPFSSRSEEFIASLKEGKNEKEAAVEKVSVDSHTR
jgi:hypothetical protein